jgi:hypothetical protein
MPNLTLVHDDQVSEVSAIFDSERVRIPAAELAAAVAWELKPQGLCRGDVCVPVPDSAALANDAGIDLQAFADLLGRPLALDIDEGAAALGTAAGDRNLQLATLEAPDFTLPDLEGKLHSLSEHRGKKVLLIAYASW